MQNHTEMIWSCNKMGVLFKNRIDDSPYKYSGQEIFATNPCSEQPLPPNGVCNLGSIDISKFVKKGSDVIDWKRLEYAVRYGVRFLDAVVDKTSYPTSDIEKWAKENGFINIRVRSRTSREKTRQFYESEGYIVIKGQNVFEKSLK